ncbi:transketolase [Pelagibius sp.]|uniref:transketolase family protein n=1 Tax=Pelagibius sp. TaxID=1931238 RepID=UPI002630BE9F|nr:transketolase [Pelagibius sp.]
MADVQSMANAIRFLAIDSILAAGEGHQGVPLGMAEIAATLYARHLKVDPADPLWPDRDRVVLSNGHGSMLLYALLHLSGYEKVSLDALKTFRQLGSVCAGHPEIEQDAGIELTTGLLGQGICSAVGMAVAEARLAAEFDGLVDHRTWAFVGDGCLQEGMGQEALSLAGHLELGKLAFLWDDNQITDDGATDLAISEDVAARFQAAHWHVQSVDGHDIEQIDAAIKAAKADPRPSMIACRTRIARGIPRLEGQRGGHSTPLIPQDRIDAQEALNWRHASFSVPEGVYRDWRASFAVAKEERAAWVERLAQHPDRPEFERRMGSDLPTSLQYIFSDIAAKAGRENTPRGTIHSSGDVCDALAAPMPEGLVLCADLEAPTNHKRSRSAFNAENSAGSYVHCGVREHLMGAMANGIAAHGGLRPIAVTYLAFSDYERASMRMAALMGLPVIHVFSHDSIGAGSNGPTHQPVEILASFRAMPGMTLFRPADAIETAECWQIALERRDGPSMLALSRQDAAPVRTGARENPCRHGAYVLHEADGQRDVTLISTGTEVALITEAANRLGQDGIKAAVVSMPSWDLFAEASTDYQKSVLGEAPRIAVEAAVGFGWERWLRPEDTFIGMTGFGASAQSEALYQHFGLTVDTVIKAVRAKI